MQISGINTKVAAPANIPTPIIVLELNAIAYPHETPVPLYLIRSSLMVCGDTARLGAVAPHVVEAVERPSYYEAIQAPAMLQR